MIASLRKFGAAFAVALAASIAAAAVAVPSAGADKVPSPGLFKHFQTVTVTRDSAGIAHIVARNFVALGYGEGYAFAQDNLCTFANDVVTLRGERSRYFGPNELAVNYSAGTSSTNLQSDLFWRYVQKTGIVQRMLAGKPPNGLLPRVRQMYTGFVAGFNAYLESGALRDRACKGKPWVRPITLADMVMRGVQITTEGSSQQFLSGLVQAAPPTAVATAARTRAATRGFAQLRAEVGDTTAGRAGSNGVGLGALDTRSRHGLVLANPHFPWRGTERFWMAQLDVPGQYDVEGGTLMGFPFIGIGFNRNIAWTHTVSTSRRFVAYQLHLVPGDPTSYYLDGKPTHMGHITVTVKYGSTTVRHTFYTTHWGLVVDVPAVPGNAYIWNTSTAYALYDAVFALGARAADQYYRMGQATSVKELHDIEAKWLAIPTFNTIAADDRGNAYYADIGATPAVSKAKIDACLPPGIPTLVYQQARVITLDGSRSTCAPANVPGTPQKGIFSAKSLPQLIRRDYVENSNDSFWLANPSHPLTGFSPIIGQTGVQQSLRTRLGNAMIAARVHGTDGLGAPKFTISTLQRMWENDRSGLAPLVLHELVADCRAHPLAVASNGHTVNLTSACDALTSYNGTGLLTARGGWLFSVWANLDSDSDFYSTPFKPTQPLATPSGLNTGPTAEPLKWLADAVQNLHAHGVPLDASFGQVQHAPQSRTIPIAGCTGDPAAGQNLGCFNAIYSNDGTPSTSGPVNAAPYGQVYDGSSLVMTTQLNPSGPVSQGILTYSQATDPTSRWYDNMTKLYSKRRWVNLPYTASELRRDHPEPSLVLLAPRIVRHARRAPLR